ncbi:hypothetical protein NL676_023320 [Syzygium grande]|nr:hypothetical protein NL676_023320 [Syzygium grande]
MGARGTAHGGRRGAPTSPAWGTGLALRQLQGRRRASRPLRAASREARLCRSSPRSQARSSPDLEESRPTPKNKAGPPGRPWWPWGRRGRA